MSQKNQPEEDNKESLKRRRVSPGFDEFVKWVDSRGLVRTKSIEELLETYNKEIDEVEEREEKKQRTGMEEGGNTMFNEINAESQQSLDTYEEMYPFIIYYAISQTKGEISHSSFWYIL